MVVVAFSECPLFVQSGGPYIVLVKIAAVGDYQVVGDLLDNVVLPHFVVSGGSFLRIDTWPIPPVGVAGGLRGCWAFPAFYPCRTQSIRKFHHVTIWL